MQSQRDDQREQAFCCVMRPLALGDDRVLTPCVLPQQPAWRDGLPFGASWRLRKAVLLMRSR